MLNTARICAGVAALTLVAGCVEETSSTAPGRPLVGSETDLSAFEGARAGQAEGGLMNLGYEAVRTRGLTTYWLNSATGACAQIITADGRYSSVTMVSASNCI